MGPVLRLGLSPSSDGGGRAEQLDELASTLDDVVRCPVVIHKASDYRVLLSAIDQGMVQLAWLPPIAAARGLAGGSIVPAAVAVRNGSSSYLTGLISLASGPIRSLADLRGVRAAWVDRDSASGYVVIRAALRATGLRLTEAFTEEIFVRSHAEVARAVREGRVDVGATCFNYSSGSFALAPAGHLQRTGLNDEDLRVLAQAGPIPADTFCAHKSVPPATVAAIQMALVDARPARAHTAALELLQADGFVRPTPEHAALLRELLATVDARSSTVPPRR